VGVIHAVPQVTPVVSAGTVVLTWPTNAAGFTLEATTNLGDSSSWTTATNTVSTSSNLYQINVDQTSAQQFFRLKKSE
jgi:hypothetical protein